MNRKIVDRCEMKLTLIFMTRVSCPSDRENHEKCQYLKFNCNLLRLLQEKEEENYEKHIGKLFKKNPKIKVAY